MRFFLPFDGFARTVAAPSTVEEGDSFIASIGLVTARNGRIDFWSAWDA